jgi:hypothetical protein
MGQPLAHAWCSLLSYLSPPTVTSSTTSLLCTVFLSLCLVGCAPQHVAYHSSADIPYRSTSTGTQMDLIGGDDEDAETREYVVFTAEDTELMAEDSGTRSYILLAPATGMGYSFADANLERSVPLTRQEASTLTDGLNETLKLWDGSQNQGEGTFYEYTHTPEQEINRVSPNVIEWYSAVRFTASHTPGGASARLLLGDSPSSKLQAVIKLQDREDVEDFRSVLLQAQKALGGAQGISAQP